MINDKCIYGCCLLVTKNAIKGFFERLLRCWPAVYAVIYCCNAHSESKSYFMTDTCISSVYNFSVCIKYIFEFLVHMVPEKKKKQEKERVKPTCSSCKRPMKGHKKLLECPKNIKN